MPQIYVIYGTTNEGRFQYDITEQLWRQIGDSNFAHNVPPFDRNEKFHPRHSIDDFIFFFTRSQRRSYTKRYNLDIIGALTVQYGVSKTVAVEDDLPFLLLDIRLSFPKETLRLSDVSKFLKYAVGDDYVNLARKLSVFDIGGLLFSGVRVFLESETNALKPEGNDFVYFEYWADYHKHFSPHFIVIGEHSFSSAERFPFPLNTIVEVDEEVPEDEFEPLNVPVPVNVIYPVITLQKNFGEEV